MTTIRGADALRRAIEQQAGRLVQAAHRGVGLAAEHSAGESRQITPHGTGDLERSVVAVHDGATAAIVADTPYAVEQHENEQYGHDPGRQAHYVEEPWRRNGSDGTTLGIIRDEVEAEMRR